MPQVSADPAEAIAQLAKAVTKPTNAQVMAVLDGALWEASDSAGAVKSGLPSDLAEMYFVPYGILPRMRLLACGWTNPGDKLREPTDVWWTQPYKGGVHARVWEPLAAYAAKMAAAGRTKGFVLDQDMWLAHPAALSQAIADVSSELRAISAAGADVCAPWFIPRVAVLPQPNAACQIRLGLGRQVDDEKGKLIDKEKERRDGRGQSALVLLGVVYLVAFHFRHGRLPWV